MEAYRVERRDGSLFLIFNGAITLETTTEIKDQIAKLQEEGGFDNLIIDLSEISFMDSSGIGFLVALNNKVKNVGQTMYLYRPTTQVLKTLELVQLRTFFNILDDEDDLTAILPE
jgi:anti-sigma B factor antagonist